MVSVLVASETTNFPIGIVSDSPLSFHLFVCIAPQVNGRRSFHTRFTLWRQTKDRSITASYML